MWLLAWSQIPRRDEPMSAQWEKEWFNIKFSIIGDDCTSAPFKIIFAMILTDYNTFFINFIQLTLNISNKIS